VNTCGTIDGLLHAHTSAGSASEYTGVLALTGGAVLVAVAIPFLHLGEGPASRYPIPQIVGMHEHRKPIGDQPGASDGPVTSSVRQPVRRPDW
jgi:hypothetical protein